MNTKITPTKWNKKETFESVLKKCGTSIAKEDTLLNTYNIYALAVNRLHDLLPADKRRFESHPSAP
jgi:hypothetical protein